MMRKGHDEDRPKKEGGTLRRWRGPFPTRFRKKGAEPLWCRVAKTPPPQKER